MGGYSPGRSIRLIFTLFSIFLLINSSAGCRSAFPRTQTTAPDPTLTAIGMPTSEPTQATEITPGVKSTLASVTTPIQYPEVPYDLISQDSLFAYLQDLTSIQPYSGWRNSASSGEAEGLDYVEKRLNEFTTLQDWGMEIEHQVFKVFLSTELWDSRLYLTLHGQQIEVPANGLRGSARDPRLARAMDSDGQLNDSRRDPLAASGPILMIQSQNSLYSLDEEKVKGRVLFLNYALIDTYVELEAFENGSRLMQLMDQGAAGLVLITQFSNLPGESHGTIAGEGGIFLFQSPNVHIPILHARLEDFALAGIGGWDDFERIESTDLVLDSDVFSPGQAGNLIVRIPGLDSSRALILGAHIDSPNNPGALDDGSGSVALLEVARVIDESRVQPAVDLYLAWFGGHEIGTYGSAHFVSTHQELLDRSLAMLQIDCLGRPLDGKISSISAELTPHHRFGDDRLLWPDFLSGAIAARGLSIDLGIEYGLIADNSNFDAFNVPNMNLIYLDLQELDFKGSSYVHYSMHWHDPYDTVELTREVGDVLVQMTEIVLAAALETGRSKKPLRITTPPVRRALFVASHTESVSLAPSMLRDLGMALAWEGFDVDLIPYGQVLTPADLEDVGVIVLLPTLDFPGKHDETWSKSELDLLESYIASGGFLVVTNSGNNYSNSRRLEDYNEDARDLNALLEPMGIRLAYGGTGDGLVKAATEHPLTADAGYMIQFPDNGVPIFMKSGLVLARSESSQVIGLLDYGSLGGQVLVVAELGILQAHDEARNMDFIKNLAHYARWRK